MERWEYVEWRDASGGGGWFDREEYIREHRFLHQVESVGVVIYEDDDVLMLAAAIARLSDGIHGTMVIPKKLIVHREQVR